MTDAALRAKLKPGMPNVCIAERIYIQPGPIAGTGSGLFVYRSRVGDENIPRKKWPRHELGLGSYPKPFGMAAIIERGDDYNAMLREGRDPKHEREQNIAARRAAKQAQAKAKRRTAATLLRVLDEYADIATASVKGGEESTYGKQLRRDPKRLLPKDLLERPIGEIARDELFNAMARHFAQRRETADKTMDIIVRAYRLAKSKGLVDAAAATEVAGVAADLRKFHRKPASKPHRALHFDRVPDFITRLRAFGRADTMCRPMLEFTVITAARTAETLNARWKEFDTAAAEWNVPADRMKQPRPHWVPLAPRALAILAEAKALRGGNPKPDDLVFGRDAKRPYSGMAMLMLLRRLPTGNEVQGDDGKPRPEVFGDLCTTHGFRAGLSSWARERTRFRIETIETMLAHKETDAVVRSYSHMAEYRKDRAALAAAWADFVSGGGATGKVFRMRARSA